MAVLEQVSFGSLRQGAVPPGYTFTRSTAATYIDSDGLLKWSAHNLLLRSQEFDNAAWTKRGTCTITANAATAPDGTLTADLVEGIDGVGNDVFQAVSMTTGVQYTPAVYIKRVSTSGTLRLSNPANTAAGDWAIDLAALGAEWERITSDHPAVTVSNAMVTQGGSNDGLHLRSNAGSGVLSVYVWGAQVNYGSTALLYLPTTSAARYDSPRRQWGATNRRWGYVGEGSRTNLCPYTNDVSNAAWTNFNAGAGAAPVVTGAYAAAPDGTTTATKVDLDAGGGTSSDRSLRQMAYASATIGVAYSGAIWLKAATGGDVGKTVRVHLENAGPSDVIYTLTSEWVRVLLNAGTTTATDTTVHLFVECRGSVSSQSASVLMWGGQIEAGPAASSDIPNPGSGAMSRGADLQARALTGPEGTALSTQGTMVVEFSFLGGGASVAPYTRNAVALDNSATNHSISIYNPVYSGGIIYTGGAPQAEPLVAVSVGPNVATKQAMTWTASPFYAQFAKDGAVGTADTSGTFPTFSAMKLCIGGFSTGSNQLFGLIYGWTIYDDAKTDAELQALTTPTKRAVSHWRTLNGTHRTASSLDKTVVVALESECDLNPAGVGGIERVEFDYDVNGGTPVKITKTARELLRYNSTTGSLNGLVDLFCYGFSLDCESLPGGTITVRATVFGNNGGVFSVPSELTIYNDTDGEDRRPSSAVVYYDYDNGDDSTGDGTLGNPFKNPRAAMNSLSGDVGGARIYALGQTVGMTATGSYSSSSWYTSGAWTLTFEAIGIVKTWRRLSPGSFTVPDDYILGVNNDNNSRHANLRFVGYEFVGPGPSIYLAGPDARIDEINCLMRSEKWTSSDTIPHVDYAQYGSGAVGLEMSAGSTGQHFAWGCQWRGVAGGPSAYSGAFDFSIDKFLGIAIFTSNDHGVDPCFTNGIISGVRYVPGEIDGLVQTNINFTQLAGANVAITIPSPGLMRIDASNSTPNDFGTHAAGIVGSTHWGLKVEFATSGGNNGTFPVVSSGTNGFGRPYVVVTNASAVAETGSASLDMNTARLSDGSRYIDAFHTDIAQLYANHDGAFFGHIRAIDCHNTRSWVGSGLNLRTCVFKNLTQGDSDGAFDFGSGSTTLLDCLFLSLSIDTTAILFTGTFTGTNFVDCVWGSGTNIPTTNTYINGCHFVTGSSPGTAPSTGAWFNSTPANSPYDYSPSPGNRGTASGLQDAPPFWYHTGAVAASRGAWKNVATGNWSTSPTSGGSTAKIPYLGLGVRVGFL